MFRFVISAASFGYLLTLYLAWSKQQVEGQIDKMQAAVFDSPGAAAPAPPEVILAGAGLFSVHFMVARLFRLKGWQAWLSLMVGGAAGTAYFLARGQEGESTQ